MSNCGHRYTVEATRDVGYEQGPYYSDTLRKQFHFGKGKEHATGKAALKAAEEFAKPLIDEAGYVGIWKENGGGGHRVKTLKEDRELRFPCEWNALCNLA